MCTGVAGVSRATSRQRRTNSLWLNRSGGPANEEWYRPLDGAGRERSGGGHRLRAWRVALRPADEQVSVPVARRLALVGFTDNRRPQLRRLHGITAPHPRSAKDAAVVRWRCHRGGSTRHDGDRGRLGDGPAGRVAHRVAARSIILMTDAEKRVLRLSDLTPEQRRLVLALIEARRAADARTEQLTAAYPVPSPRLRARRCDGPC